MDFQITPRFLEWFLNSTINILLY